MMVLDEVITIHPLGTMNACTKVHGNSRAVWTKVVDWLMLLAWLKTSVRAFWANMVSGGAQCLLS